jgi:hypothetical protein
MRREAWVGVGIGIAIVVGCSASGEAEQIAEPATEPASNEGTHIPASSTEDATAADASVAADGAAMPLDASTCDAAICTPGETQPCGNCGTRTCTTSCNWSFACKEPPNACKIGTVEYTSAGCTVAGTFKKHTCGPTCAFDAFGPCADPNANQMTISTQIGAVVSAVFGAAESELGKRPMGTCGTFTSATADATYQRVGVAIANPTSQTARISVYQSRAPGGQDLDMVLWIYKSSLPPGNDVALLACDYGVADDCIAGNPCGNPNTLVFAGIDSVVVPPNGKVLAYSTGYAPPIQGTFQLNVRTDALQ